MGHPAQTQIQGTAYTTTQANWRRIAHIMADVIYERLLGEKGYFDTRIVYIAATGPRDRRTKRLAIMDQDSENNRLLTDGSWLALTPRFHPTRDEIAFMSYANNRPRVYLFDLSSGRQTQLGDFAGMTFAPRFAPDGSSVIMAVQRRRIGHRRGRPGQPSAAAADPFRLDRRQPLLQPGRLADRVRLRPRRRPADLRHGLRRRWSERISFGYGRYATPVWSPRGDLIAFTRYGGESANFAIGVMRPDGSGERILSEGWVVEGPTFAPNGRVLMFCARNAVARLAGRGFASRLVSVDITGFNERPVTTPTDASDPAWSPLGAFRPCSRRL